VDLLGPLAPVETKAVYKPRLRENQDSLGNFGSLGKSGFLGKSGPLGNPGSLRDSVCPGNQGSP